MVFEAFTMVFVSGTLGWETKTMVSKPETIFFATGKMVFLTRKIFSFEKTMVSGTGTRVCVKNTMVLTSETTVTAAKKTVSIAPTMVCKVLSIVFVIIDRASPIRSWFFLELQPARFKFEPGSVAEALRAFLPEVMLQGLINPGAIPPIFLANDHVVFKSAGPEGNRRFKNEPVLLYSLSVAFGSVLQEGRACVRL